MSAFAEKSKTGMSGEFRSNVTSSAATMNRAALAASRAIDAADASHGTSRHAQPESRRRSSSRAYSGGSLLPPPPKRLALRQQTDARPAQPSTNASAPAAVQIGSVTSTGLSAVAPSAGLLFFLDDFSARADGERRGARSDRRVASERSRQDASLGTLQIDAGPRRPPSACSETFCKRARRVQGRDGAVRVRGLGAVKKRGAVTT